MIRQEDGREREDRSGANKRPRPQAFLAQDPEATALASASVGPRHRRYGHDSDPESDGGEEAERPCER